jgi:hypothetical protein
MMQITPQYPPLARNVFPLLRDLSSDGKLKLAELLIESVRSAQTNASMESLFGAWESDTSVEDLIKEIYSARTVNHDREEF